MQSVNTFDKSFSDDHYIRYTFKRRLRSTCASQLLAARWSQTLPEAGGLLFYWRIHFHASGFEIWDCHVFRTFGTCDRRNWVRVQGLRTTALGLHLLSLLDFLFCPWSFQGCSSMIFGFLFRGCFCSFHEISWIQFGASEDRQWSVDTVDSCARFECSKIFLGRAFVNLFAQAIAFLSFEQASSWNLVLSQTWYTSWHASHSWPSSPSWKTNQHPKLQERHLEKTNLQTSTAVIPYPILLYYYYPARVHVSLSWLSASTK